MMSVINTQSENELAYTGERMVPGAADAVTFWEHVQRYRFAAARVKGMDVVDIACGEGYGSAALIKAGAASLVGIDISAEAVEHARRRHGIDARVGSATTIPLPDASCDVVVSFETVEHVHEPAAFINQCSRILRPGGSLIISTPNPDVYKNVIEHNPFHVTEMPVEQFRQVVEARFNIERLYGQTVPPGWYMRSKGFGRLTKWAQKTIGGRAFDAVPPDLRSRVVDLCSKPPDWFDRWLFMDAVQPVSLAALQQCCYVIATAKRRD
jgi:SAM-dependent methyltransferase